MTSAGDIDPGIWARLPRLGVKLRPTGSRPGGNQTTLGHCLAAVECKCKRKTENLRVPPHPKSGTVPRALPKWGDLSKAETSCFTTSWTDSKTSSAAALDLKLCSVATGERSRGPVERLPIKTPTVQPAVGPPTGSKEPRRTLWEACVINDLDQWYGFVCYGSLTWINGMDHDMDHGSMSGTMIWIMIWINEWI
jgi:hypothetical protein